MLCSYLLLPASIGWATVVQALTKRETALAAIEITNADDVRRNLHLPADSDGMAVRWTSSDPSVISADGIVTRQATDTTVTLTASIGADRRNITASVRRAVGDEAYEAYMFAYFTGSSIAGEKIYFSASDGNDALTWAELNDGEPVLTSTMGTKGLRDPFIMRSHEGDTFYLLATDLSIGSGTSWGDSVTNGSRYLEIWESNDLVTWSDQRHVLVSPPTAGMTWAPEAYYDADIGAYVVYWASALFEESDTAHSGSTYHRMLISTTRDFVTFSEPTVWQDAGMSRIDSTVIEEDGVYYRFTKDEGASGTGCSDIIMEDSTNLTSTLSSWTITDTCIGRDAGTSAVEGPTSFKSNAGDVNGEKFYLFVDEYSGRGYIPLQTEDITAPNWTVPSSFTLPTSPRHGTVLPITATELAALTKAYGSSKKRSSISPREGSPVLPGLWADPNIAVFNGSYYIYPTTDGFPSWSGKQFFVWKSDDLVHWTKGDEAILTLNGTSGNVPWSDGSAWAPTIAEKDGRYYFYFSGNNPAFNIKTIGVAVADSPGGPYVAQDTAMINNTEAIKANQAIDPCAFHDPVSGKYYLYWGNGQALLAELSDDMLSIKQDTLAQLSGLEGFNEGSFVVYRQGLYHFTYSVNDTRSEDYAVGYATSASPAGPFTYRGPILQKNETLGILGTGHNSVVNVPATDDWYICYHRFQIPGGNGTERETTIDRLFFDNETGLIEKVVPTLTSVAAETVPAPSLRKMLREMF